MNRRLILAASVSALSFLAPMTASEAQRGDRGQREARPNREQLEQRLRQRFTNLLRTQLKLDDEQMRQLVDVNRRFDQQRRDLVRREMLTRRGLREEVMRGDSANPARIEQLLTDQFRVERERLDLNEAEQRELSRFLTAVQRAQYLGVQEQIRREMDQLRGRGMPRMGAPPDGDSGPRRRPPPE
jgi:hypothetical protein